MNHEEAIRIAYKEKPFISCLGNKIHFLARICLEIKAKNIDGNVAECGVYKGGSARLLAIIFEDRQVYLFDSFCGFIKNDSIGVGFTKGSFSETSLDSVKKYLDDKPNCLFFPGWLPDSAKDVEDQFCLIHMDMDHYDSTIKSLAVFWPKVKSGGAILFDDWDDGCCPGIRKAISEFFPADQKMTVEGNQCVIFKE